MKLGGGWKQVLALFLILLLALVPQSRLATAEPAADPIKHIVVIMEENHTFDNYFGTYPGANGINSSGGSRSNPLGASTVFSYHLPGTTVPQDLCHSWDCAHVAYDNGKMDGFAKSSGSNLSMGYFDYHQIPDYWNYASQFVLLDNFFTSVMGPSLPNHLYLVAGQSGGLVDDYQLGKLNFTSPTVQNDVFEFNSLADELSAKHISWEYYAGAVQTPSNWNPMPAFESIRDNTSMTENLAQGTQFIPDVVAGALPAVAWVMPSDGGLSEHPPSDVRLGETHVVSVINAIMSSPYWDSTAIFLTWDDYGGWFDHVAPPQVDGFGYGFRTPCLIISPYSREGFVDHTLGDFTSIMKFIETVDSLQPLTTRDSSANSLTEAFDFTQKPRSPLVLPGPFLPLHYPLTFLNGTAFDIDSASQNGTTSTSVASTSGNGPVAGPPELLVVSIVGTALLLVAAAILLLRRR